MAKKELSEEEKIDNQICICQVKIDPFYKSILTPLR